MIKTIKDIIEDIQENLVERFGGNLKGLILYGSWAKSMAHSDSDVDL